MAQKEILAKILMVLVHDKNIQKVIEIFQDLGAFLKHYNKIGIETRLACFELDGIGVDIVGNCRILERYSYNPDDEMFKRINLIEFCNKSVPVISPEDVFLFKALCQRDVNVGKSDVVDAIAINRKNKLDIEYLFERAKNCGGLERVRSFIDSLK